MGTGADLVNIQGTDNFFTQDENARSFDLSSNTIRETRVAPRTIYAVSRVQQQFGASQSTASAFASVMHRDVNAGEPLAALLSRNAFAAAGETNLRFRDGQYELTTFSGVSLVQGDAPAMARLQRNNVQSLRSNVVLRWEYRPGSFLYVVWQQDRSGSEPGGRRIDAGDLFSALTAPGIHSLVVKTSFWVPVG